jgi:hypothetical protein
MSYTYLQTRQAINGFVFTIDGHLVHGVPTSVVTDEENQPASLTEPFSWRIAQPTYFYDDSRSYLLDRTGSYVKILNTDPGLDVPIPLATCIITKADTSNFITLKVLFLENGASLPNLNYLVNTLSVVLWDNYKFCSNTPSWIPTNAESRNRWIPILSNDFQFSVGQKIDLKGGFGSVDGLGIPMVLDTKYQNNNRIQRLFREEALAYTFNNFLATFPTLTEEFVNPTEFSIDITLRVGASLDSIPTPWDEFPNYPWVSSDTDDIELVLLEPVFIDTEAFIPVTRTSGPLGDNGTPYSYDMIRRVDGTTQGYHGKYTVIYDGMPFPIGQGCKTYELTDIKSPSLISPTNLYRGLVENINLQDGLAAFNIEVSSILFTPRVNTDKERDLSVFSRVPRPARGGDEAYRRFYNKFIASQVNPSDIFQWVKIGALALPIIRRENIDYEGYITGTEYTRQVLKDRWGISSVPSAEGSLQRNFTSGTVDIGYAIGFKDVFEQEIEVSNVGAYETESPYTESILNWFKISQLVDGAIDSSGPAVLPTDSPWGFYILEKPSDETQFNIFQFIRTFDNLITSSAARGRGKDDILAFNDYISNEEATLIHLFQPFTRGKRKSFFPVGTIGRSFFYEADQGTLVRNYSVSVNLIDVILQVLTSTGSGKYGVVTPGEYVADDGINGEWDLIPSEFGMGIPLEEIDLDSFLKVLNKRTLDALMVSNIFIKQDDNPQEFLEDEILKPYFLAIATNSAGKIILIDTSDSRYGVDSINIGVNQFVKVGGERTRVSLAYEATDLVDGFTYNWTQPWLNSWVNPRYESKEYIQGNAAVNTQILIAGRPYTIGSKTNIFRRIQTSPIDYELRYSPVIGQSNPTARSQIVNQALTYLSRYNRIVPRVTFELFWELESPTVPDIGDTVTLSLDALPDKQGLVGTSNKLYVGKVIDIQIDRIGKTARYTAILTDSTLADSELVWNLTAQLRASGGGGLWTLGDPTTGDDIFCFNNSTLQGIDGERIFEFDGSQFLIGSRIIVWDRNWRYVTNTTIIDIDVDPDTREIISITFDDDTDFATGYRITLATIDETTSPYKQFLSWFNLTKKFL